MKYHFVIFNTKSIIVIICVIAGIGIIGFTQVDAKNPHDLEARVSALEEILTPTIQTQPEITPTDTTSLEEGKVIFVILREPQDLSCTYLNMGTVPNPNLVVNGWCPSSHEYQYFISDARALPDSLIIINVQRTQDRLSTELQTPPVCTAVVSGTFVFPRTTFTGFIIDCQGASPEAKDKLAYTIL